MTEINLPFSPLVRKYIQNKYGHPWHMKNDHLLAFPLCSILRPLKKGEKPYTGSNLFTVIPPHMFTERLGKVHVGQEELIYFEKHTVSVLMQDLFLHIDKVFVSGGKIGDAIYGFREDFGLTEVELTYDRAFKWYQRNYFTSDRIDNKHFREIITQSVQKSPLLSKKIRH